MELDWNEMYEIADRNDIEITQNSNVYNSDYDIFEIGMVSSVVFGEI